MVEVQRLLEEGSVVKELEGSFTEETSLSEFKFQTFSSLLDNPDRGHLVFQIGKLDFQFKNTLRWRLSPPSPDQMQAH